MFAITLIVTARLLDRPLPESWLAPMVIYLSLGRGFFTFGIRGFGNLGRQSCSRLSELRRKYVG